VALPKAQEIEVFVNHSYLEGLTILHLSDLHIKQNTNIEFIQRFVNYCLTLDYDFIVITGDIIDCKVRYIKKQLEILNTLGSQNDVLYISGNHDIFYGLKELNTILDKCKFMDNTDHIINFHNNSIQIVGLADRFAKFFNIKREEKKIKKILQNSDATIFISHQPKDYKIAVDSNTALFLCGHTHGGQIFPFHYLVSLVQPFLAGLFYKKQTAIYVNKGLGTWGIDFRFKADSEITLLKLNTKSVK